MRQISAWWDLNVKNKHVWWELIALALIVFVAWGPLNLPSIPAVVATAISTIHPIPPTVTPLPTATPPSGTFYFTLPAADLSQVDSLLGGTPPANARLIIFVKETTTMANGAEAVRYTSRPFCVQSVAFLDANNEHMQQFDKEKTKSVLFAVRGEDLGSYGEAMLGKAQLYLIPDSACGLTPG